MGVGKVVVVADILTSECDNELSFPVNFKHYKLDQQNLFQMLDLLNILRVAIKILKIFVCTNLPLIGP